MDEQTIQVVDGMKEASFDGRVLDVSGISGTATARRLPVLAIKKVGVAGDPGNLMFGVPARVAARAARRAAVERALAEADLEGFGARDPATLSGGQRARVALMRTLLSRPRVLLLDEPFGKLDAALREDFRRFVFEHTRVIGLPTLLVTHDADDARAASGKVLTLE